MNTAVSQSAWLPVLALGAVVLSGCATAPQWQEGSARDELQYLWELNALVRYQNRGDCEGHVRLVEELVDARFHVEPVFSCPDEAQMLYANTCHVSAMVTTPSGRDYVLDNGTLTAMKGLGTVDDFVVALEGKPYFMGPQARFQLRFYVQQRRTLAQGSRGLSRAQSSARAARELSHTLFAFEDPRTALSQPRR